MFTETKNFRFESAHRLAKGYVGKCSNLHGHSWNGEIAVECKELNGQDMGVDFSTLGTFCKYIEEKYDHKTFLCQDDKEFIDFLLSKDQKLVITIGNPTCETISKEIHAEAVAFFAKMRIQVKSVTIKETCSTSCTYTT